MDEFKVERQIAVITGAGQGIGRATAKKLAATGVHVVLVGRTLSKLEAVVHEIQTSGYTAVAAPLDITLSGQVEQFARALAASDSKLDMLINCAGEAFVASLVDTDEADWDRILNVNLKGPYLMTQALLPLLRRSENPSIVNLVSKVALKGYEPVAAYTAAKTGLLGFTRALAAELRCEEIRVVALCPGPVDTPMRWEATPDFDRKLVIDTESVASTIQHLVTLPRGVTMGEILLQSVHYD